MLLALGFNDHFVLATAASWPPIAQPMPGEGGEHRPPVYTEIRCGGIKTNTPFRLEINKCKTMHIFLTMIQKKALDKEIIKIILSVVTNLQMPEQRARGTGILRLESIPHCLLRARSNSLQYRQQRFVYTGKQIDL